MSCINLMTFLFLIPLIKSSASIYYALLAVSISLNSEIMSPYSHYIKKGLVYIAIIDLSSCQPSFYLKYIKANAYFLYKMCSVSLNKCIFLM